MEITDAETKPCGGLEAAGRGVHADGRGSKGVVGWEDESSPVLAVFVGGVGWAGQDVVPF